MILNSTIMLEVRSMEEKHCKNCHYYIQHYVKNQLQEDMITDQISIKEYTDPFTGEPVTKGK